MPTTNFSMTLLTDKDFCVTCSILDLWRAVGFGMNLILPVREHMNATYFMTALTIDPQSGKLIEPSFWGENQTTPNIPLANFYLAKLKSLLSYFNSGEIAESEQNILEAYHEGQAQLNQGENARDFWYRRPQSK